MLMSAERSRRGIRWYIARNHMGQSLIKAYPRRRDRPQRSLINVNFSDCPANEVAGISATVQGRRDAQIMRIDPRRDGRGIPYYWIAFQRGVQEPPQGTDLHALAKLRISVTPLKLDLTDMPALTRYARIFE